MLAGVGPLHDRELGVRAGLRRRLLARDRDLARGPDLPVLHDHGPEDGPGRARRADRLRRPRRGRQHAPDGAADQRVRDQGRAARRPRRRLRGPAAPRPAPARAEVRRGRRSAASRPGWRPAAAEPAHGAVRGAVARRPSALVARPRDRRRHRGGRDAGARDCSVLDTRPRSSTRVPHQVDPATFPAITVEPGRRRTATTTIEGPSAQQIVLTSPRTSSSRTRPSCAAIGAS